MNLALVSFVLLNSLLSYPSLNSKFFIIVAKADFISTSDVALSVSGSILYWSFGSIPLVNSKTI